MYTWSNAVITKKGNALLSKLTSGHSLSLVRAAVGTGIVDEAALPNQSGLTDEKQDLRFSTQTYPEEGTCAVPVRLYNTGLAAGYAAMQVGIFAMDPDEGEILYLIAQASRDPETQITKGTPIPAEAEMPGYSAEWTFYLKFGQADGVSVTVDPSNTVNEDRVQSILKETITPEWLGLGNVDNTSDASKYVAYASKAGTADKTKNNLVIRFFGGTTEGTDMFTFNGATGKSVNFTPSNIKALPAVESVNHDKCFYRVNGSVNEWINPPMILGQTYQTAERWCGKPVCVKFMEVEGPTAKSENLHTFHAEGNAQPGLITPIRVEAVAISNDGFRRVLPYFDYVVSAVNGSISIGSDTDRTSDRVIVSIWYVYN